MLQTKVSRLSRQHLVIIFLPRRQRRYLISAEDLIFVRHFGRFLNILTLPAPVVENATLSIVNGNIQRFNFPFFYDFDQPNSFLDGVQLYSIVIFADVILSDQLSLHMHKHHEHNLILRLLHLSHFELDEVFHGFFQEVVLVLELLNHAHIIGISCLVQRIPT